MSDINGTAGPDTLNGTSGADNIDGLAGNDTIGGGAGDDKLTGGTGADTLNGGDGNDRLYSDARLFGPNETNDPGWYPRNSADHFAEHDTLNGGAGDDEIFAGYGDTIDGGDGTDTLSINFLGATAGVNADFRVFATQSSLSVGGATIANIENVEYIDGSNFDDVLGIYQVSPDSDAVVNGNGGNDHIYVSANAGIFGAQISGGDGNDTIDARGNTRGGNFYGGAGDDTIYTGEGYKAAASGGDGNDTIYSWGSAYGDAGNDHIVMGNPIDVTGATPTAYGGDGDDTISASTDPDFRDPPEYHFAGEGGADTITGGAGNDYLTSVSFTGNGISAEDTGIEHDRVSGGAGNDHLFVGYGDDADGGADSDVLELSLAGATSGVTLNTDSLVSSTAFVLGGGTIQHMEGVARLYGSAFADTITVGTASVLPQNSISVLTGDGNDTITDTSGALQAVGGNGDDRFVAKVAGDSFSGGDGIDTVDYSGFGTGVDASLTSGSGPVSAGSDVENLTGSAYADTLTGSYLDNVLSGNAGNDGLTGLAGNDTLRGGAGDDVLAGGDGNDILDGGAGTDTADYSSATAGVTVNLSIAGQQDTGQGKDTLASIEHLIGSDLGDTLTGGSGDDNLEGGSGNDTLAGGDGNDILAGGAGFDTADYSSAATGVTVNLSSTASQATGQGADTLSGFERLVGSGYADTLTGTSVADRLEGGAGADTLIGLAGNDILDGGAGVDKLYGGTGNDTYHVDTQSDLVFENPGEGTDTVNASAGFYLYDNIENLTLDAGAG
ncbi:MAG TPA: calcium-binding protein, partial [Croceibacterium sp.]